MSTARLHHERGMAVIAALVIVFAAAALAAAALQRQSTLTEVLRLERDHAQASWLLQGGLDWAQVVLFDDARRNSVTHAAALWTQPIAGLPVGPAHDPQRWLFSGVIEDEQGKFNLAHLVQGGRVQADAVAVLERLLPFLAHDGALLSALSARLLAQARGEAIALRGIDDLAALAVFAPAQLQAMRAVLTVLPRTTLVNVNTARPEVLAAVLPDLGLAQARRLVAQRDAGQWFVNPGDFMRRARLTRTARGARIGVHSDWFRVTGEVRAGDVSASLQALLQRDAQGRGHVQWVLRP